MEPIKPLGLHSVAEAAKLLGIRPVRVRELCRAGRLPGARKIGRDWIIPDESLRAYEPGVPGRPARRARTM